MALSKVYDNIFRLAESRDFWISPYNQYHQENPPDIPDDRETSLSLDYHSALSSASTKDKLNRIRSRMSRIFTQWQGEYDEEDQELMNEVENYYRAITNISSRHPKKDLFVDCLERLANRKIILTNLLFVHHVFSEEDKQIKVDRAKVYVYYLNVLKRNCHHITSILVTSHDLTPTANNQLRYIDIPFVIFKESELTFLPIDHTCVPHHELLQGAEREAYLGEVGIHHDRNMYIQIGDPIVKFYGWKRGDIIRITRDYELLDFPASKCISYRTVV